MQNEEIFVSLEIKNKIAISKQDIDKFQKDNENLNNQYK